jgi:hypothetical protein
MTKEQLREELQEIIWSIDSNFDDTREGRNSKYYIDDFLTKIDQYVDNLATQSDSELQAKPSHNQVDKSSEEANPEQWKIIREADDPLSLRLSIGGIPDKLGYIVYRGDTKLCLQLLYRAYQHLEHHYKEQGE